MYFAAFQWQMQGLGKASPSSCSQSRPCLADSPPRNPAAYQENDSPGLSERGSRLLLHHGGCQTTLPRHASAAKAATDYRAYRGTRLSVRPSRGHDARK